MIVIRSIDELVVENEKLRIQLEDLKSNIQKIQYLIKEELFVDAIKLCDQSLGRGKHVQ